MEKMSDSRGLFSLADEGISRSIWNLQLDKFNVEVRLNFLGVEQFIA